MKAYTTLITGVGVQLNDDVTGKKLANSKFARGTGRNLASRGWCFKFWSGVSDTLETTMVDLEPITAPCPIYPLVPGAR